MKKVIIALFAMAIVSSASAAPAGPGRGGFHGGGRPVVIVHGGGYYSPFYSPYGYYGFGYPFYPYGAAAYSRPTKLDIKVMDIKNDYADKIASVKMDRSLSGRERRQQVRLFKQQRDHDVREAKANYYKS